MSSIKKQIEDAVLAILNDPGRSPPFSQSFTAVRGPRSIKKLEQTSTLQVIVAAVPVTRTRLTRAKLEWKFAIGVGLFKNVGFDSDEEIEPTGLESLNLLAEEIAGALDVNLDGIPSNGPLVPEIDYEPDDGVFWNKGIATVQINAQILTWVNRA